MRATMMLAVMCAVSAGAQQIPIRQLGPAEATASEKINAVAIVRPLSNGRVVVAQGRRVLMFSPDLAMVSVAIDSTALTPARFPTSLPVAIIPARGDTTYVVDQGAGGLIVLDPAGKAGRIIAVPKASDISLISTAYGFFRTFTDPKGRLVYRGAFRAPLSPPGAPRPVAPDTFPIVRADFDTRTVDTIAVVRVPSSMQTSTQIDNGRLRMRMTLFAYPTIDAWTLLADGTIAIIRGADYHVDWIHPDGSRSSGGKMPFDWRRISDDLKVLITDSLQKMADATTARMDSLGRAAGNAALSSTVQDVAPASTLPDYYPPLRDGAARSDADGNLWILPTTSSSARGGLLYDVVNREGEIFERVQLPPGCALAGLGTNRVVYLTCIATSLERRRVVN